METGRKLEYSGTFYRPSASCFFAAAKELGRIRFSRAGLRKKTALVTLQVFRARHISNCQLTSSGPFYVLFALSHTPERRSCNEKHAFGTWDVVGDACR